MPAYDGHTLQRGADASNDTSELSRGFSHISVNRKYRGGLNQTRDPFISLQICGEEDAIKKFKEGAIRKSIGYRNESGLAQPHILIKVSDSIIKGRIAGNAIELSIVWSGLNPELKHAWFAQAEDRIFYQDGESNPLMWDGFGMEEIKVGMNGVRQDDNGNYLESFDFVMPKGQVMLYAHGRMWVSDGNLVYASNHLYGNGNSGPVSRNLANFEETTYPASGGGFGSPSVLGDLTGMSVIPRHPEINGHGEIVVWHKEGAYAIIPTKQRNEWVNQDIQQVILVGRGAASADAIVSVNNDIWYRSTDKSISSLKHSLLNQRDHWGDKSLSREVQSYLDKDDRSRLQFCVGIKTKQRLLMTTNHSIAESKDGHQFVYGSGMTSLDFDSGSTTTPQLELSWDGLWTGLNITTACTAEEDTAPRYLFFDAGLDGENRLFELLEDSPSNDYIDGKEVEIKSHYTQERLFSQLNPREELVFKKLQGTYVRYRDAIGLVKIQQSFRNSDYGCWFPLGESKQLSGVVDKKECYEDYIRGQKSFNGAFYSDKPSRDSFEQSSGRFAPEDESFDILTELRGVVTITRNQAMAELVKKEDRKSDACPTDFSEGVFCCDKSDLEYSYNISNENGN